MCEGGDWGISSHLLILGAPNTKVFGEITTNCIILASELEK